MVKNIKNKIIKDSFDGYKNFRLVLLKLEILFIISNLLVLVPTDKVMKRFKEIIIPLYKSIEENLSNIETIVDIRDSLLPKLMSEEIKV